MEKEMICIVCPKGCPLKVCTASDAGVTAADVSGQQCKRGAAYAVKECTDPVRTLTTTVRLSGSAGRLAPVKSAQPVPKGMLAECMKVINSCTAYAPLKVGDVIVRNILNTGIDIVSTSNISGEDSVWTEDSSLRSIREPQARGQSYSTQERAGLPPSKAAN